MRICGIDPGRETGLVIFDTALDDVTDFASCRSREDIVAFLAKGDCPVVVVEDFLGAGPRSADAIFTLKLLGFVEGVCQVLLNIIVEFQPPQWRKAFLDKAQGFFRVHKERHMKDALAHVFSYIERMEVK